MNPDDTRKAIAHALRELANKVEAEDPHLEFTLHAKQFPEVTAEKIRKREEAARRGYVLDISSPSLLKLSYDGSKL